MTRLQYGCCYGECSRIKASSTSKSRLTLPVRRYNKVSVHRNRTDTLCGPIVGSLLLAASGCFLCILIAAEIDQRGELVVPFAASEYYIDGILDESCYHTASSVEEAAKKQWGLALMRPNQFVGWDYGEKPPIGWHIADGRLTGNSRSTPLLSGFSFSDVQLHFRWATPGRSRLIIQLPEVNHKTNNGLMITLNEGEGCGRLTDNGKQRNSGKKVEPFEAPDRFHTAVICRSGPRIALTVDGERLYEVDVEPERRFGLGLAVADGEAALENLRFREPPGTPIFNGRDLTGWRTPGNIKVWGVENGELVLQRPGDLNYLQTDKLYGNFTLSCEFSIKRNGNSGIGVRTTHSGWPSRDGMEFQILDRDGPLGWGSYGAIYGNAPPFALAYQSEKYNQIVLKTDGPIISAWVNGQLVQHVNTVDHPELKHHPMEGWIGFQDHSHWIRVRNVRVLEAPAGQGLEAWRHPQRSPADAMLDGLLNSEWLSRTAPFISSTLTATVSADGRSEPVVVELTGPGAVVRIAPAKGVGRLAFYFDGEKKPRIECKPGELGCYLPMLVERSEPVPTCLTYSKSLRIVLHEARRADYRIDYVHFPGNSAVPSYMDPTSGFPHGWLATARFRAYQFRVRWGKPRENDRLQRVSSDKKTINPGTSEPLVKINGAGIVHWMWLAAEKNILDNNDVWLEVTIDGERAPAVATPIRYWFPGLASGGNYENFLWTIKEGALFHALAMPFGKGITLALTNRGSRPLKDVGLTVGIERATDQTREGIVSRLRLHGVFQSADATNEMFHEEGTGRWIGIVWNQPRDKTMHIESLLIDGKPAAGWHDSSLDSFLGREGDFRAALCGRQKDLAWRYLLLSPVGFEKSAILKTTGVKTGDRLAVFYLNYPPTCQ